MYGESNFTLLCTVKVIFMIVKFCKKDEREASCKLSPKRKFKRENVLQIWKNGREKILQIQFYTFNNKTFGEFFNRSLKLFL